jgi:ribonuclease P/MRP protein subunit POP5
MTSRPPTLREKRRYVLVRIDPAGIVPDAKELYYAVNDAVASLWGDATAARVHAAVVAAEGEFAVVRCRRGTERELAIALITVTSCNGERIALRTLATSGTIESLKELIGSHQENIPATPLQSEEYTVDGRTVVVSHCSGQKVDVIEKGFKNATRFFLTTEDLEDI